LEPFLGDFLRVISRPFSRLGVIFWRDMFDANNKAVGYLYRSLCQSEFDQVQTEDLACWIWLELKNAHAGNVDVQARLCATYRREYDNFTHLTGKSINSLFQRFTVVVNNMRANVDGLPYDDHDRAVKLLHALDHTVWDGKVEAILESEKYTTSDGERVVLEAQVC
jgi:hypothetical protein